MVQGFRERERLGVRGFKKDRDGDQWDMGLNILRERERDWMLSIYRERKRSEVCGLERERKREGLRFKVQGFRYICRQIDVKKGFEGAKY